MAKRITQQWVHDDFSNWLGETTIKLNDLNNNKKKKYSKVDITEFITLTLDSNKFAEEIIKFTLPVVEKPIKIKK